MAIIVRALSALSDTDTDPDLMRGPESTNREGGPDARGGAPVTDHILYLISDLQTLSSVLIGQSVLILGSDWSADNERCPHGTRGQLGPRRGGAI